MVVGRKSTFTKEELDLFREQFLDYLAINRGDRDYDDWSTRFRALYFQKYPVLQNLFPDIERKDLTEDQLTEGTKVQKETENRYLNWFRREARKANKAEEASKTPSFHMLIPESVAPSRKRAPKIEEVYSKLFLDESLRQAQANELERLGADSKSSLAIRNRVAREHFNNADEDIQAKVHEEISRVKTEMISTPITATKEPGPEEFQQAIEQLPNYLSAVLSHLRKATGGWSFSVIMGGPVPRNGGNIMTASFHEGTTVLGHTFPSVYPQYEGAILKPYREFLDQSFSNTICRSRSLYVAPSTVAPSTTDSLKAFGDKTSISTCDSANSTHSTAAFPSTESNSATSSNADTSAPTIPPSTSLHSTSSSSNTTSAADAHDSATTAHVPPTVVDSPKKSGTVPSADAVANAGLEHTPMLSSPVTTELAQIPPLSPSNSINATTPSTAESGDNNPNLPSTSITHKNLNLQQPNGFPSVQNNHCHEEGWGPINTAQPELSTTFHFGDSTLNAQLLAMANSSFPVNHDNQLMNGSSESFQDAIGDGLFWDSFQDDSSIYRSGRLQHNINTVPNVLNFDACHNFSNPLFTFHPTNKTMQHEQQFASHSNPQPTHHNTPNQAGETSIVDGFTFHDPPSASITPKLAPPTQGLRDPLTPKDLNIAPPISILPDDSNSTLLSALLSTVPKALDPSVPGTHIIPISTLKNPSLSEPSDSDSSRRASNRPIIKSRRNEQMDLIGTQIRPAPPSPVESMLQPPDWFTSAQRVLGQQTSLGAAWLECISAWSEVEACLGYGMRSGAKIGLSAQCRPIEWQKWTTKHKSMSGDRPFDVFPSIPNPADLGLAIVKWWHKLQPSFRCNVEVTDILSPPIPKSVYSPPLDVKDPWASLAKAGPNGLASLVILLMWWGKSLLTTSEFNLDTSTLWTTIVIDVTKTLAAIKTFIQLPANTSKAPKRKRTESESVDDSSKRCCNEVNQSTSDLPLVPTPTQIVATATIGDSGTESGVDTTSKRSRIDEHSVQPVISPSPTTLTSVGQPVQ